MPSTCSSTALLAEGLSAQTVVHHHRVLHQALGQAVKWDLLPRNVVERVIPPKRVKPELRILTVSEVRRLLGLAEGTDYFLPVHLAVHTGLRRSELCGLLWSDVDLDARALTVVRTMVSVRGDPVHFAEPKSRGSRRVVAFGSGTASLLRERRDAFQARGLGDSRSRSVRGGTAAG